MPAPEADIPFFDLVRNMRRIGISSCVFSTTGK